MKRQSRREAREALFTQVFQMSVQHDDMDDAREFLLDEKPECLQNMDYIKSVTDGIAKHEFDLVKTISAKLRKGWTFNRLPKVSRCLLEIAVYEIKYCDNIPPKVSINEAVLLAKKYGGEKDPALINGILASIVKDIGELNEFGWFGDKGMHNDDGDETADDVFDLFDTNPDAKSPTEDGEESGGK